MKQRKKTKKAKKTMWGIIEFPVALRRRMCAVAECRNITVSALMEEVCREYANRKDTKELLAKEYMEA